MSQPKIKTFEAACKALKLDPAKATPKVVGFPKQHAKALIAIGKLMIIVQALNGDWKPNWQDTNQPKYYGWWDLNKDSDNRSGFRLFCVSYGYDCSNVGSRLCFRSRELAEWAVKQPQIKKLYKEFMLL
jgi:hypothetical protein